VSAPDARRLALPVRWWGHRDAYRTGTLQLDPAATAFVLVDCHGASEPTDYDHVTRLEYIAPALRAARAAGLRVVYFHGAPGGEGGPRNIVRELHGTREGTERLGPSGWKPRCPTYAPELAPREADPEFQKPLRNGFPHTGADRYLRTWGIDTLVLVGFSLKSCLYHTAVGAQEHDYRVIVLRDGVCPPGTKEFPDTLDPANPEGGWTRYVVLRLIEDNLGYTATCADFARAAELVAEPTSAAPPSVPAPGARP
jgi:nicotinamidase-related amidase